MSIEQAVIDHRVTALEKSVDRITEAVQQIAESTNMIAQVELRHAETRSALKRAFAEIETMQAAIGRVDDRVKGIEIQMPSLNDARQIVQRAMYGVLTVVGLAIVGLVIVR